MEDQHQKYPPAEKNSATRNKAFLRIKGTEIQEKWMSNTSTKIYVLQHTFDMEPKNKCHLKKRYIINIIANQMATYLLHFCWGVPPCIWSFSIKIEQIGTISTPCLVNLSHALHQVRYLARRSSIPRLLSATRHVQASHQRGQQGLLQLFDVQHGQHLLGLIVTILEP